jgi:hypothetical protein
MHALLVTFTSAADEKELRAMAAQFADALQGLPGLLTKAWPADGETQGGFYLVSDRESAAAYASGPLVAGLRSYPAFSGFTVRDFAVDPELSARTGIVAPAGAQA